MNIVMLLHNPDFWIAIMFAFMISFIVGAIAQDVYDTFMDLLDEDDDIPEENLIPFTMVNRIPEVGEIVYDDFLEKRIVCIGFSDENELLFAYQEDNTVFINRHDPNNLYFIAE